MKSLVSRKLSALADSLADLKEQLRAAVATEVGKAVAATVREILEELIARRPLPKWEKPRDDYYGGPDGVDDWDDPCQQARRQDRYAREEDHPESMSERPETPFPPRAIPMASLALAVNTGHWLYRLSRSWLCGVGGAAAVCLAAGFGGPALRLVVAVAASVQQLSGFGDEPTPLSD